MNEYVKQVINNRLKQLEREERSVTDRIDDIRTQLDWAEKELENIQKEKQALEESNNTPRQKVLAK